MVQVAGPGLPKDPQITGRSPAGAISTMSRSRTPSSK